MAEIVHLPQQRTGNVLMRPVLREYEIPFLGRSSVDPAYAIPVSDLMVSVRNNTVLLRSKRLNKFIIPHLSNAHNFSFGALSIYKFLCDLQSQNIMTNVGFSWGPLESETLYLPRVTYKNILMRLELQSDLKEKITGSSGEALQYSLFSEKRRISWEKKQ